MGIRDSESRMKVLGFNVWLHKYLALIIAGAFAGLAGNLYAYYNRFVGPNDADLAQCMEFVLMVSIGGQGTLIGSEYRGFSDHLFEEHGERLYQTLDDDSGLHLYLELPSITRQGSWDC